MCLFRTDLNTESFRPYRKTNRILAENFIPDRNSKQKKFRSNINNLSLLNNLLLLLGSLPSLTLCRCHHHVACSNPFGRSSLQLRLSADASFSLPAQTILFFIFFCLLCFFYFLFFIFYFF